MDIGGKGWIAGAPEGDSGQGSGRGPLLDLLLAVIVPMAILAALPGFSHVAVSKLIVIAPLLLVVIVLRWRWRVSSGSMRWSPWGVAIVGALVMALLLSVQAYVRIDSAFDTVMRQLLPGAMAVVLMLAACGVSPEGLEVRFRWYLVWAGLLVSVGWLLESSGVVRGSFSAVRGGSTLGNPGLVGEVCAPAALVALSGAFAGSWGRRAGWILAGLGLALVTGLSGSQSGLLALVAGGAGWGMVWFWRGGRPWGAALFGVGLAAVVVGLLLLEPVVADAASRRFYLYEIGVNVVGRGPIWGGGAGSFGRLFLDAQGEYLALNPALAGLWSYVDSAHSVWLNMAAERGVVAALAWLVFFGLVTVRVFQRGAGWAVGVWVSLMVISSFSVSYDVVPVKLWIFLWIGLHVVHPGDKAWDGRLGLRVLALWRRLVGVPGGAWLLRAGVWGGGLFLVGASGWVALSDGLVSRGRVEGALALAPFHAHALMVKGSRLAGSGDWDGALACYGESAESKAGVGVEMALGMASYRLGDYDEAERAWRRVAFWHRRFMPAFANLAVLYHETGRPELARRHLVRAMSLRPSDPRLVPVRELVEGASERGGQGVVP